MAVFESRRRPFCARRHCWWQQEVLVVGSDEWPARQRAICERYVRGHTVETDLDRVDARIADRRHDDLCDRENLLLAADVAERAREVDVRGRSR